MPWRYTVNIDADTNEAPQVIDDGDTIRIVYSTENANPRVHSTSGPTSFDDFMKSLAYFEVVVPEGSTRESVGQYPGFTVTDVQSFDSKCLAVYTNNKYIGDANVFGSPTWVPDEI